MRLSFILATIFAFVFVFSFQGVSRAQKVDERAQECADLLQKRTSADVKTRIPAELLTKAKCIVVVPNYVEVAVVLAGGGGKGLASCRHDKTGEWGAPAFYDLARASVGVQLGGGSADVISLVMTEDGVNALTSGAVTLGSVGAVAIGGKGGSGAGATTMKADFINYATAKGGLLIGVDLGGVSIAFKTVPNTKAYGKELSAFDTLMVEEEIPPGLMVFNDALKTFTPKP